MQVIRSRTEILNFLKENEQKTLGFVPTMGAIHQGHTSLIEASKKKSDITLVSIFVNPKQFNDKIDFEAYPKTESLDLELIKKAGCDVVFIPEFEDVYQGESKGIDLKNLDNIWEGSSRPGHFEGVVEVLYHFFDLIKPDITFFGQKDFQQTVIVKKLIEEHFPGIKIYIEKTLREKDGLAMSSRNVRLTESDRKKAPVIYETLKFVKENTGELSIENLEKKAIEKINGTGLKVDYFKMVNSENLQEVKNINDADNIVCITAVYAGNVRLLDNEILK